MLMLCLLQKSGWHIPQVWLFSSLQHKICNTSHAKAFGSNTLKVHTLIVSKDWAPRAVFPKANPFDGK